MNLNDILAKTALVALIAFAFAAIIFFAAMHEKKIDSAYLEKDDVCVIDMSSSFVESNNRYIDCVLAREKFLKE